MPMKTLFGVLALAGAIGLQAPAASADIAFSPALGLAIEGERALNSGDYVRSIELNRRAMESLELTPLTTSYVLNNLCVAYAQIELFHEAIEHCEQALKMDPRDWRFLNNRGNAYMGLGKLDEAIADYRSALEIRPKSSLLSGNLEIALSRKKAGATRAATPQKRT